MLSVDVAKALANERRLQILGWLKEPRAHFPPQVDGDLVRDGVCGVFIAQKLGVFPDARGLSDRAMQAVAREFNFAETTFVLPPADPRHTRRVRIFTPRIELPFAGHPTVGTAAVLARLGVVDTPGGTAVVVFEEGIGPDLDRDRP